MNIGELADIMGVHLIITRYDGQGGRCVASFERTEVKDGHLLVGTYGDGHTPYEAIRDYVDKIKGKWLIINAMDKEKRRGFGVPLALTSEW